ncbi:hypothetical protein ALC57_16942 [Trachymyrmex cornetzi]|uniref:Mos1 transposase HTH domain-containing protein n=1 Tax=Trachymyrmex cornetzi TaxID=471704 RepID=A0A151ITZ8_9HYME|nr:hypothetical protein ALC57_16942 [Trachymyrmex cornetzi]
MIMDNRRIKIREIAEAVGISRELVCHILTEELGMRKLFIENEEVIAFVDAYFAKQDAQYYLNGLKGWEHRWKKCIDLKGDYVEK